MEAGSQLKDILMEAGENPSESFTRSAYEDSFLSYKDKYGAVMKELTETYMQAEDKEGFLLTVSEDFLQEVLTEVESRSKKRSRKRLLFDYDLAMVVYVFPLLLESDKDAGGEIADALAVCWKKHFPQSNIKASSFEEINGGFKHRFCYITTAVCESLGKPDNCYELNILRNYRDHYLLSSEDGEAVVRQYYDVAPTIVKHINKLKDSGTIYKTIWQDYLKPCISLIEDGKNEACQKLYSEMVFTLQEQYFS